MEHDPIYNVIGGMIGYRCKRLTWQRQTRLRVMEILFQRPRFSIRTSFNIPFDEIALWLNNEHPAWTRGPQEAPTPPETAEYIQHLCEANSRFMISKLGRPTNYETIPDITAAIEALYEVKR